MVDLGGVEPPTSRTQHAQASTYPQAHTSGQRFPNLGLMLVFLFLLLALIMQFYITDVNADM